MQNISNLRFDVDFFDLIFSILALTVSIEKEIRLNSMKNDLNLLPRLTQFYQGTTLRRLNLLKWLY